MNYPDRETAERELEIAGKMNPGPWTAHSRNTALACQYIAHQITTMDEEKAYILGLLHDIGRRVGIVQERHLLEGYRYCIDHGWDEPARICITHSFMIQDIGTSLGKWDISSRDYRFMKNYVANAVYDDYDRLVQLCDSLAMATGFCLLEKRFIDVALRYGTGRNAVPRWKAIFALKTFFEEKTGCGIYDLLPAIRDTTFAEPPR